LARNVLTVEGLVGTERDEDAAGLLQLLIEDVPDVEIGSTSVDALGGIDAWWDHRLETAFALNLLPPPSHIGPPPCRGSLVWVEISGDREPAVVLQTEFETDLPFAAAALFCDPERWTCFPFWCDMEDLHDPHNGIHRYRETVSLDCDHRADSWTLVVDLDFSFRGEDDANGQPVLRVAEYRLRDGLPQERVLVNEGSIVVEQLPAEDGGRVKVTTTKRLKFAGSFDGPALAHVLCNVGYLGYVEDLLHCAAGDDPGTPFPGVPDDEAGQRHATRGADKDFRGLTKFTIQQVATALEDCLDDCAKRAKEPCEETAKDKKNGKGEAKGSSPFETLVNNAGTMWVRMLNEGAAVADAGLRSARLAPGGPPRERTHPRVTGGSGASAKAATAEVVEDYTALAKWLIARWSGYAGDVATKLEQGTYDADSAVGDVARAVSLTIESGARLGWEAVDAITLCTGIGDRPYLVDSEEFSSPIPGATLHVAGDFANGFGDPLPAALILIVPPELSGNETRFRLRCDATGRHAGTYWGRVKASKAGNEVEVGVRITVP
jgi:hypothetical protein